LCRVFPSGPAGNFGCPTDSSEVSAPFDRTQNVLCFLLSIYSHCVAMVSWSYPLSHSSGSPQFPVPPPCLCLMACHRAYFLYVSLLDRFPPSLIFVQGFCFVLFLLGHLFPSPFVLSLLSLLVFLSPQSFRPFLGDRSYQNHPHLVFPHPPFCSFFPASVFTGVLGISFLFFRHGEDFWRLFVLNLSVSQVFFPRFALYSFPQIC